MHKLLRSKTFALASIGIGVPLIAIFVAGSYVTRPLPLDSKATFVGRQSCIKCHSAQTDAYNGSHHDRAMELATPKTVLAQFNEDQWYEESGQRARFFRKADQFFAEIDDGNEQTSTYEIKWTFGVAPLQQYMVALTPENKLAASTSSQELGRIQVLRWSWDTRRNAWFHLDPPDVHTTLAPDDELAWTGPAQRWNNMCAACHSTDVVKKFDLASLTYHTHFSEIDVSCEACHGPASIHLQIANRPIYRKDPHFGHGLANLKSNAESQIQSCAPCHSRRDVLTEGHVAGSPYADFYSESLLDAVLYFDDGQIKDEVFEHGSFVQSKMYHKGIRCSDCHDPHTAKLKFQGNQLCTSCHQHPSFKYDTPAHHFHKSGQPGSQCVDCHMPTTTYMEVHARRDHSIRIPRPDLSVSLGTPNACTSCHLKLENIPEDKRPQLKQYLDWMTLTASGDAEVTAELKRADQWCDDAINRWYGVNRKRPYHFATALHAARTRPVQDNAVELLRDLLHKRGDEAPAIARATALHSLVSIAPEMVVAEAIQARDDASPLVRAAAAYAIGADANSDRRFQLIKPMLNDPVRSVRVEAARTATTLLPAINLFNEPAGRLALQELRDSLLVNIDRSNGNVGLGVLAQQQGNDQAAIKNYEDAIRVEPAMVGARTNYAAILDQLSSNAENANPILATQLRERATQLRKEELPLLKRDFSYAPTNASIAYRLGLAEYLQGQMDDAEKYLRQATELEPTSNEYALGYVLLLEKRGKLQTAIDEAQRVLKNTPNEPQFIELLKRLTTGSGGGK